MAGAAAKKRAQVNKAWNKKWSNILLAGNGIYIILALFIHFTRVSYSTTQLVGAGVLLLTQFFCFRMIKSVRAQFGARGGYEYYQDVMLVSLGTLILSLVTDYAWYILITIPAYGAYKIVTLLLSFMGFGGGGGGGGAAADLERRENREWDELSQKKFEDMSKSEKKRYKVLQKRKERKDQGTKRRRW